MQETKEKTIAEILGNKYLSNFRVFNPELLFEPYWKNLLIDKCPICGNKLKFPWKKTVALCNGKKHKIFIIKLDRLNKIKETDYEAINARNPWSIKSK